MVQKREGVTWGRRARRAFQAEDVINAKAQRYAPFGKNYEEIKK